MHFFARNWKPATPVVRKGELPPTWVRYLGRHEAPEAARICRKIDGIVQVQAGVAHPTRDTYICATEAQYRTMQRMRFIDQPQPRILKLGDLQPS